MVQLSLSGHIDYFAASPGIYLSPSSLDLCEKFTNSEPFFATSTKDMHRKGKKEQERMEMVTESKKKKGWRRDREERRRQGRRGRVEQARR